MAARNVPDGKGHGQHRQTEGERNAQQPDTHVGESRGQNRAPATAQNQPEGADEFCAEFLGHECPP